MFLSEKGFIEPGGGGSQKWGTLGGGSEGRGSDGVCGARDHWGGGLSTLLFQASESPTKFFWRIIEGF